YVRFANCGLPYHLSGEIEQREALLLHTPESLARTLRLDVRTRHRVTAIDRGRREVSVVGPEGPYRLRYDALLLATAAAPGVPPIAGRHHAAVRSRRSLPA